MKVLIYDSGVGGRSVFDALQEKWKDTIEDGTIQLDYFADSKNFPYGTKSEEELTVIVAENLKKFSKDGYDLIGVACNTASSVIDQTRDNNVILAQARICTILTPTIAKIIELQPTSLFIIGTQFTISQHIFSQRIKELNLPISVTEQVEQDLVIRIETKDIPQIQKHIHRIISQLQDGQTLLLGCTHFSVVRKLFEWEIEQQGKKIQLIDPAEELVREIQDFLSE